MIKKTIITGLLIIGLIFLGNITSATSKHQLVGLVAENSVVDSNFQITALKGGAGITNKVGLSKGMFAFRESRLFWRDSNGKPYFYLSSNSQGNPQRYGLCSYFSMTGIISNCTYYTIEGDYYTIFQNFFNNINVGDVFFYNVDSSNSSTTTMELCRSSQSLNKSMCFNYSNGLTGSKGYTGLTFSNISTSLLGYAPGQGQYGGGGSNVSGALDNGGIELSSDYSALNYYEKHYGWDKSICYVGVDNVTSLYGQNGVSFQLGKGLSIFDTYDLLYGSGDLQHYYVWLNTWLLNYEQWFNRDGNPLYLANYNTGLNQVDLYYDNLTFPFSNNPVAFYFMADNIVNQSPESTMGSSVVSYCNIKLNSGTFEDIIDQADKNNITDYSEQYNTTHGLNADGSSKEYGAFLGSGVEIAFSGNVTVKNTLKNFFDEFDKGLSIIDINTNNRILPTWIVSAFIFVVLFKFLRKR